MAFSVWISFWCLKTAFDNPKQLFQTVFFSIFRIKCIISANTKLMYVLFLIEIYELLKSFWGFFFIVWLGLIIYDNILKWDKCATEHIEIHKSFSLWCIIVNILRQTKVKGSLFETKFHFHSAQSNFVYMLMPPVTRCLYWLNIAFEMV